MGDFEKQFDISFKIINQVAIAKKNCSDAISFAKKGQFKDALKKIDDAKLELGKGQKHHGALIQQEAAGKKMNVALLLVHAEDQLMTTESLIFMSIEIINLYQTIKTTGCRGCRCKGS